MLPGNAYILADGIPTGVIFAAIVVVFWALGAIFNPKAKPDSLKRPTLASQQLAEARRRIRELQNAQKPAVTPRIWQQQQKKARQQQKQKQRKPQPPPLPAVPAIVARNVEATVEDSGTRPLLASGEIGSEAAVRRPVNETAKNVRLMLQKNGVREAFVLGEVLGKPVGLRDT